MLTVLDHIPENLLALHATQLHEVLSGPTLIHLEGRQEQPVFVSVLLHGNEDTGWDAIRALLNKYKDNPLPRSLSVFIGNVEAARHKQRFLDGQSDYNRIWKAGGDTPEHIMMQQLIDEMKSRDVFISIDVHNNTGLNPHYACVNKVENKFLHLATLFNRTVVYFTKPEGVQAIAFANICPAVTVECGQAGQKNGIEHSMEFLEACLHLNHLPDKAIASHDIDLYHTVAIVKIPHEVSFSFNEQQADLRFPEDIEHYNFRELPANTPLAKLRDSKNIMLEAWDENGKNLNDRFFKIEDNTICTAVPVVPAMLTTNTRIVRQDCFCYLMERLDIDKVIN